MSEELKNKITEIGIALDPHYSEGGDVAWLARRVVANYKDIESQLSAEREKREAAEKRYADLKALIKMDCDCASEHDRESPEPGPCLRCAALLEIEKEMGAEATPCVLCGGEKKVWTITSENEGFWNQCHLCVGAEGKKDGGVNEP